MLALPAKTLAAGFLPSSGALFLCWVYMAASGLLIAEVNVNTLCSLEARAWPALRTWRVCVRACVFACVLACVTGW